MNNINLIRLSDIDVINKLKKDIFDWAIQASLESGFCKDKKEASDLYTQRILQVFSDNSSGQHCFNVCLNNDFMIGRVWLMERDLDLRISYIGLDELYQKQGHAWRVIKLVERYANKINFNQLSLNVFSHLPHAKRLYERLGFVVTKDVRQDGRLVTSEMVKEIHIA